MQLGKKRNFWFKRKNLTYLSLLFVCGEEEAFWIHRLGNFAQLAHTVTIFCFVITVKTSSSLEKSKQIQLQNSGICSGKTTCDPCLWVSAVLVGDNKV